MNNLQARGDWVIIKPIERETLDDSLIVIPKDTNEGVFRGEIISVGPDSSKYWGQRTGLNTLKVGDIVLYDPTVNKPFMHHTGEKYIIVTEDRICVILKKEEQ